MLCHDVCFSTSVQVHGQRRGGQDRRPVARPGEHPASGQRSRDPGRVGNKKPTQKKQQKNT